MKGLNQFLLFLHFLGMALGFSVSFAYKPMDDKQIQMRQVVVDEKFSGKGIARRTVRYSEEFARKVGFEVMVLHAARRPSHSLNGSAIPGLASASRK